MIQTIYVWYSGDLVITRRTRQLGTIVGGEGGEV